MNGKNKITIYGSDLYGPQEKREESVPLVVFRIGSEWYGVAMDKVKEVVPVDRITFLPAAPAHILGIVNLRGNLISVTDPKRIFGMPEQELTEESKLVVIFSEGMETGLLADEVTAALEVPVASIDPTLATLPSEKAEYVEGECRAANKLIGILNVEKLLERR